MDVMKKMFSGVAFVLFVLALVWLFTYDSSNANLTASRNNNPNLNQARNSRVVRTTPVVNQPVQVTQTTQTTNEATYVAPEPELPKPTQQTTITKPIISNSGSFIGTYGHKDYTRQGQTGTYRGAFDSNGNPSGYALMEYRNGNLFLGEYQNGQRHGTGYSLFKSTGKVKQRYYSNGESAKQKEKYRKDLEIKTKTYAREGQSGTYSGPFKGNAPHGVGVYAYSNGDVFIGEYSNGQRHGKGTFCKANGSCYQQVYNNGGLIN